MYYMYQNKHALSLYTLLSLMCTILICYEPILNKRFNLT